MFTYNCEGTTRSVYIHWPFCPYKCHFCPFVALASHDHFMEQYHYALKKELRLFLQQFHEPLALDTIFIGGGTPSTYPDELCIDLFEMIARHARIQKETEITIEINPGTVVPGRLETWKRVGINRLSIGVQSLNDGVLKGLNRLQTKEQVASLLEKAVPFFDNISVDLILGIPGISREEWQETIAWITSWPITHISVYFLTVHEGTPLYFRVQRKQISLLRDAHMVSLYEWTCDELESQGFIHYELSNFARPGFACRHNKTYWLHKPYKGVGLGACSFDGKRRFRNEKNLARYLEHIETGEGATEFGEELTHEQLFLEKLMLGLRQECGIVLEELETYQKRENRQGMEHEIATCIEGGFLMREGGRVKLTVAGLAVENDILARLARYA